jgi:predicted DNA-binding transcriptional regulator AlpA
MTPKVATEDLLDTEEVAEILGLAHRNTVSQYQRRYADMPRPVFDRGPGRVKLWLRPEIERWAAEQAARGRSRPARRSSG